MYFRNGKLVKRGSMTSYSPGGSTRQKPNRSSVIDVEKSGICNIFSVKCLDNIVILHK